MCADLQLTQPDNSVTLTSMQTLHKSIHHRPLQGQDKGKQFQTMPGDLD